MDRAELEEQFHRLNAQFGQSGVLRYVSLHFKAQKFFEDFKDKIQNDRWGEVAFFVERKNGKMILIRSSNYPKGVYRIPTGGIRYHEQPLSALYREITEELGLSVKMHCFLGAVIYRISYGKETVDYCSFVFHLKELGGVILQDAAEREIQDYTEATPRELARICERLRGMHQDWSDFRDQTTSFFLSVKEAVK